MQLHQISPEHLGLIKRFYKQNNYVAKVNRDELTFSLQHNGKILAAVRLAHKSIDSQPWWFLRSMVVAQESRGTGIGREFLRQLLYRPELKRIYCYPFAHLQGFYQQAGFALMADDVAPAAMTHMLKRYQNQGKKLILMTYTCS